LNIPRVELSDGFKAPSLGAPKTYFTSSGAVKFTEALQWELFTFLRDVSPPYRLITHIPFEEPLRSSIKRFLVSMEAYYESSNPLIPRMDLIRGASSGPQYAEYLKNLRFKSFITSSNLSILEEPTWWNKIEPLFITDIGDIFNYQYLIFFEEEVEDYKYGFEPVNIDSETLNKFGEVLRTLVRGIKLENIDEREILLSNSGSIALDKNFKKNKIFDLKNGRSLQFSEQRNPCKRCVVQIGPQNARDAVINQLDDLNTIKLIEFQVMALLEHLESYTVNKDLDKFDKKYIKFQKKYRWFLCRDFTKEGITKPRQILTKMLQVLNEEFPEINAFKKWRFYENFELIVDDQILKPLRGHGLGMANSLTTLMQIVIFLLVKEQYDYEPHIHLLTHNDDAIIGAKKARDIEEFWALEEEILKKLSILRNPKKSFFGKYGGVFIERYFSRFIPDLNRKESYQRRELKIAYCAANIVHAKQIISSQVYIDREYLSLELEKIVSFWGYEFFPEEIHYPAFCGGWFNESLYGVSLDLVRLNDLPFDSRVVRAYNACKNSTLKPRYKKGLYNPPVNRLFPDTVLRIEDRYQLLFDIGTRYEIECKYSSLKVNPELYIKAWDRLLKDRRKNYLKEFSLDFETFIKEITTNSINDFIPLDFMIEKSIKTSQFHTELEDPYNSPTPLISYLAFLNGDPKVEKNPWSILFTGPNKINSRLTASERKRIKLVVGELSLTGKLTKNTITYPESEEDFLQIQELYFSPFTYLKVYGDLNNPYVPIIKREFRNPIIEKKRQVYGRFLTFNEIYAFTQYRFIEGFSLENPDLEALFEKKFPPKKEPEEEPSELYEEESEETKYYTDEGLIKYPLPAYFSIYLDDPWRAEGDVKKIFERVLYYDQTKRYLIDQANFEGQPVDLKNLFEEYQNEDLQIKEIFQYHYGYNLGDIESEEEDDPGGFDLFN
jgi:hypothetical protein